MQRAGFIGLGAMGAPMAKRIVAAGFVLSVFDVHPENAEQLEEALFGGDGAAEILSPESAVVVMSTVGPGAVRGIEGRLAGRGVRLLDAPVSGGGALGLDPRSVFETIRHGAANSFMLEDRGERMLGREFVPAKSALDIFVKDMGLVRLAAGDQGFRTPLADAAHRVYQVGSSLGLGEEDDSGVVRVFENADGAGRAGVSLQI